MGREIDPILRADDGEEIRASSAAEEMLRGSFGLRGLLTQENISTEFVLHLSRELRENRGRWAVTPKEYFLDDYLSTLAQWLSHEMHIQAEQTSKRLAKAGHYLTCVGIVLAIIGIPWHSIYIEVRELFSTIL